ncbi:MAG: peptidase M14 [Firmicutes bacterium HGW-Firmicutes-7]|nr:MAG: peptidase M14 [Firmicutes bacterium HGW-Firmicutes-7]
MQILRRGSSGPDVKLIQTLLARIGYNPGPVDGKFGPVTAQEVVEFQRNNELVPDGIVGPATWNVFDKLLRGYDEYTIRPGDTLNTIAWGYYTSVNSILVANPGINPNNLTIGQVITVPYGIEVVFTDIDYTYEIMQRDILGLKARYPFLEVGSIGQSVMGKNLYYIRLGRGENRISYNGSHHANEWITTPLLMKFIENFAAAYATGNSIRGYDIQEIFDSSSIYIVPMLNPDGVNLVLYWPNYTEAAYTEAAQLNRTNLPLPSVWKANIRGVDLNSNYPALWEEEKELEIAAGITEPAPRDYGGPEPLSEPETSALAAFTRNMDFSLVIAYHTQGRVIFYQFENLAPPESMDYVREFSRASGYAYSENPEEASYAGYKDWFIQEFRRPGFTMEVGLGRNPISISQFNTIYNNNEEIMLLAPLL